MMMRVTSHLTLRTALVGDTTQLANLFHSAPYIHRHLDWRSPLEWLGRMPFLLLERDGELVSAFACPPDPEQVAWVRVFACAEGCLPEEAWSLLLVEAVRHLRTQDGNIVAAIALQQWFEDLLLRSGFSSPQKIVLLEWEGFLPPKRALPEGVMIRPMLPEDIEQVHVVDIRSFAPLWQTSVESLTLAFGQSSLCTVAVHGEKVIGYQMSTQTPLAAHLSRLAVLPEWQGKSIGYNLVYDLQTTFKKQHAWRVTVNTQSDNHTSLALYDKLGFHRTGEQFPVYTHAV